MECLGCKLANQLIETNVVFEDDLISCILDIDPLNEGHTLILPKRHFKDLEELDCTTSSAIMNASIIISRALKEIYRPDGISIIQNGGLFNDLDHYHMHVFPRYKSDGFGWIEPINKSQTQLDEVKKRILNELKTICKDGVISMIKKILLSVVFLGYLTACSYANNSSNQPVSQEPEIKQTEAVNNVNNLASNDINSNAKDITNLIPVGWHILEHTEPVRAEGDLNKDGIQDIAIVIESTQEEGYDARRSLLIAFGNKDHSFSLSIIADQVILGALEGGGWGDPFDGIIIDRGSVVVSDFGGSGERWYHKYRFRFQDNDWYLIGATMGWNHSIKEGTEMVFDEEDYNLLTGDYIFNKTNENGEEKITKGNRGKKKLLKLSQFNIDDM